VATGAQQQIIDALQERDIDALAGKGGFFLRGRGWVSYATAKRLAGITGTLTNRPRRERISAWGEYAWIAGINRQQK
jgi:hypothetical protein